MARQDEPAARLRTELDRVDELLEGLLVLAENGGEIVDQRQVDQLGQPFRRLGADRTGSDTGAGLGLSIVAAVASAHGGTLELRARPEGGIRVTVTLPLAPAGIQAVVPA